MPNIILADGSLSLASWDDWIYDILKVNISDPTFPRGDRNFFDPFDDARNYLVYKKIPTEKLDEAIFKAMMERVDLNLIELDKVHRKEIARLIDFLQYSGEALVKVFFSRKYDSVIVNKDGWYLKAYILKCLSHAKLSEKQCEDILLEARSNLEMYKSDIVYLINVLRFSHRQFLTHKEFFESFTFILNAFTKKGFTKTIRFNLTDQLQEFKYHRPDIFENGFEVWVSSLPDNAVTDYMKEMIPGVRKYKLRADMNKNDS